jgi:hypothetical protein
MKRPDLSGAVKAAATTQEPIPGVKLSFFASADPHIALKILAARERTTISAVAIAALRREVADRGK